MTDEPTFTLRMSGPGDLERLQWLLAAVAEYQGTTEELALLDAERLSFWEAEGDIERPIERGRLADGPVG